MKRILKYINLYIKNSLIKAIKLYQRYISPDHSIFARHLCKAPFCKYHPTCSQYMIDSIEYY